MHPEDKLALLLETDERMGRVEGISARTGNLIFIRERKAFANSEGADLEQTIYEAGGGVQATAVGNGEVQRRSYPQSMGRQQGCSGWEYVRDFDLVGNAERVASEAVALLTADRCPSDITTSLIIGGSQVGLQIHESCGHAIELDRVMGSEAAYAGTSFLTTDKLHDFRYGSEQGEHYRRQHPPARTGIIRLGRRGCASAVYAHRRGGTLCRLPDVARDRHHPGSAVQPAPCGRRPGTVFP